MTNQDKERAEFESLFRPKWRKGSHLQRLESGLYLNDNFHAAWEGWQASAKRYTSPVEWMSMDSAPKNGTLIRLLVIFEENSIEDESAPAPTIGANSLDQTGVDLWDIAGWDWENDCFTRGIGTPIGWLHITTESIKHQSSRIAELEAEVERLKADRDRLDWLADPKNIVGQVLLPTAIVARNIGSLRDAIDEAMKGGA